MLAVAVLAGPVFASKADELLKDAESYVRRAEAAKGAAARDENYEKAVEKYKELQRKEYVNTLQGVKALYGIARIHETAKKGKFFDQRMAYDTYKQVVKRYDRPREELERNFESAEIREVNRLVASARENQAKLADELDKKNSDQVLYKVMDFLVNLTGAKPGFSYWFAIILVTFIVKIAITPLTKAQFKSMKEMQRVAPLVKQIQEKYKGDQKAIGEKTWDLYKEHGINPLAGCLPILVQMPILWLLYYMIRSYEYNFAKATFLWIGSGLSHIFSFTAPFGGHDRVWFTAKSLAEPDLLLVVLYVISMFISTKLSSVDPSQAEQQKMMSIVMPVMFAFIFMGFQSAFLLYWLMFNILQTAQQYHIIHGGSDAGPAVAVQPEPPKPPKDEDDSGGSSRVRRRRRR